MSKSFFFLTLFLFSVSTPLQAGIITIHQEPDELIKLRSDYERQLENAASPERIAHIQKEMEAAKEKTLQSPTVNRQVEALEKSRDIEIEKIQTHYTNRIAALKKEAEDGVERKYQVILDNLSATSSKRIKNQYIVDLKRLEETLIRQNNLAGALVVQTERNKAMGLTNATTSAPKQVPAPAKPATVATAVEKPAAAQAAPEPTAKQTVPMGTLSSSQPKLYTSQTRGLAGSGSNVSNNVYSFAIDLYGEQAWLTFHSYGRETNNTYGEVYLITPAGQRHQVESWSPSQLKATNYFGVKGPQDVQPIKTDISSLITTKGTYQIEFIYRDGNEPLNIYQVEIKTW